ncbi:uncharacterized protein LOC119588713 [Penaeus monodon]|uniref:uncharacterized protein LOC119588713 n=1 Tax=Penaeus monodon TaxID=6687 RepID=UPI0018A790F3|nr:uncharacterized protein LOC119588713 [Penaeus monodon]
MRNTWCSLLVVQVLALQAATMPQGPRVPHNPQGQQIIFGTHSVSERPVFRPHPSIGRPFLTPNVPKQGSASDPNLNGQTLAFPSNFDVQRPPTFQSNGAQYVFTPDSSASRADFGSVNQISFPDESTPAPPPTPNSLGTRILISAPCIGNCMTKRSGRCELDASCLFG